MTPFTAILARYGETASLTHGGVTSSVRAFLQPVITRRTERVWRDVTELGERDTSRYLAFLPPDAEAEPGDVLCTDGAEYEFLKAEKFRVRGAVSHIEAVLSVREALHVDGA